MIPSTIHILEDKKYRWVNVVRAGEEELQWLEKTFGFHPLDLKECLPPLQRPKVVPRPGYLFAILVFPTFNPKTREIEQQEVDVFIMKDAVVTVHDNHLIELKNLFQILEVQPDHRQDLMQNPLRFVSQILDELFDACFPMLYHISNDIDALRGAVLHGMSKATVREILRLKNNVVAFRKAMQPHRDILKRTIALLPHYFKLTPVDQHYFERLVDHTKEIWDHLETYRDAIDAVQDTHTTLISFRLNEIVKTLTIFSVIVLSLTLFTNLFIVPAFSTPVVGTPGDFWALLGIMTFGVLIAIAIFKKKEWL